MFILRLLRPKHIPDHKTDWDWWLRLYNWIIRGLLPVYKRSAISDTVILGDTQVIHNIRDYWYEQELHRFHIDAALNIEKRSIPYSEKRKFYLSRFFCWSDSLLIFHEGGSYNINRDKIFLIDTDKEGILKLSTEKDLIFRSEFVQKEVKSQQEKKSKQTIKHESHITPNEQEFSPKIRVKDTTPIDNTTKPSSPKMVKYQGFEENNLF